MASNITLVSAIFVTSTASEAASIGFRTSRVSSATFLWTQLPYGVSARCNVGCCLTKQAHPVKPWEAL